MAQAVTETELIMRYLQHEDRSAVEALFAPYETQLFRYLWQMLRHQHDSEDALQETIRKALAALPRYQNQGHFKSWLFRIAHNTAIDRIRLRKKVVELEEPEILEAPQTTHHPSPTAHLIKKERKQELEQAVANLSAAEQEVLHMRFHADLTFKEIAKILDQPIGTVLARVQRAKERLKNQLAPS